MERGEETKRELSGAEAHVKSRQFHVHTHMDQGKRRTT